MDEQAVDALVKATLEGLGLPVARIFFTGKAESWITYELLSGRDGNFADDAECTANYAYRAHIFSKRNYMPLLKQLRHALKSAGFHAAEIEAELYEQDTGYYHIPVQFNYMEE